MKLIMNQAYYPGNALNQLYALRHPRWEDFEYTYLDELDDNPLAWLGNGYTSADYDGSTRTAYLDPAMIDYPPIPEKPRETDLSTDIVEVPAKQDLEKYTAIDHVVPVSTI